MKDRLQILQEVKQIAYEMVDMSSALSDERLAVLRDETGQYLDEKLTDQEIIAELVGEFLDEAYHYYDAVKDDYAAEE